MHSDSPLKDHRNKKPGSNGFFDRLQFSVHYRSFHHRKECNLHHFSLYPNIHYHVTSGDTEQVTERLDRGLLDMAFIVEPPDLSKYNYLEVPEYDTWGVLMRKDNPLAAKEAIAFDDLLDIPIFCSEQSAKMDLPRWCSDNLDRLNICLLYTSPSPRDTR